MLFLGGGYCAGLCTVVEKLLSLKPAEIYEVIINGKFIFVLQVFNPRAVFEERITSCTEGLLFSNSLFLCTAELRLVFNQRGSIGHKN
jgi:hypothetical protein